MRSSLLLTVLWILASRLEAVAHDIPNARVDRSIQATLEPGRLRVDYQVSLAELTLTQDLRQLIGDLPGADRRGWFEEYGRVAGPLNAKGILVTVDGGEVELHASGFDLVIEGHLTYTFHFEVSVPRQGRLVLNDTNYLASEGTSRLALRGVGATIAGDTLPTDVTQIPARPSVLLTNQEERRTRRLTVDYAASRNTEPEAKTPASLPSSRPTTSGDGLSRLLDDAADRSRPALLLVALILGAAHALQPGHGKTMVLAASIGPDSSPLRGALLGLGTASVHMTSVALIAGLLLATRSIRTDQVHQTLAHLAGFVIAAIGFWKLGRQFAGFGEHEPDATRFVGNARGMIPLALAGGAIPCWDAVALLLLSEVIGRLLFGLALVAAFSLGMAGVLVAIGSGASRFQLLLDRSGRRAAWERRLGIASALILAVVGLSLLRT